MATDYTGAIAAFVADSRTFNTNTPKWVVIHKTGGGGDALAQAHFFASDPAEASTHYVVGQDGTIVQVVPESRGAGGNCCTDPGHAPFLPDADGINVNLNTMTISIEHCDPSDQNTTPLTAAQQAASFKLIHDICKRHGIPMRAGDANGGIIGHSQIAPARKPFCPNVYPWSELWAYLQQQGAPAVSWEMTGQGKQALAYWNSTTAGGIPPGGNAPVVAGIFPAGFAPGYNTGIAKSWQAEYQAGRTWGPPLSYEFATVDWNGAPIVAQMFAGGRAEFSNGVCRWYPWQ